MTPATGSDPDAALATLNTLGPLPTDITVALDAAYDSDTTHATLAERDLQGQIAQKGTPAPIQATNRWPVQRTFAWATSTANCAGAPNAAGWWSSSSWRWPALPLSVAGCSVMPGPITAGTVVLADAHDRLLTHWWPPRAR